MTQLQLELGYQQSVFNGLWKVTADLYQGMKLVMSQKQILA